MPRNGAGGASGDTCTQSQGLPCLGVTGAPGWGFKTWRTRVQQLALLCRPSRADRQLSGRWEPCGIPGISAPL